jgi:hypothetical protein
VLYHPLGGIVLRRKGASAFAGAPFFVSRPSRTTTLDDGDDQMNIVIDLKKVAVIVVLAVVIVGGFFAWQAGALEPVLAIFSPKTPETTDPTQSPDARAAVAAATAFYTIDYQESPEAWAERVCAVSTVNGCEIVRNFFMVATYTTATEKKIQTSANVIPVSMVDDLGEKGRIWLLRTTLTNPWDGNNDPTDLYVHVVYDDQSSQWLFERVLFEQEAERYKK